MDYRVVVLVIRLVFVIVAIPINIKYGHFLIKWRKPKGNIVHLFLNNIISNIISCILCICLDLIDIFECFPYMNFESFEQDKLNNYEVKRADEQFENSTSPILPHALDLYFYCPSQKRQVISRARAFTSGISIITIFFLVLERLLLIHKGRLYRVYISRKEVSIFLIIFIWVSNMALILQSQYSSHENNFENQANALTPLIVSLVMSGIVCVTLVTSLRSRAYLELKAKLSFYQVRRMYWFCFYKKICGKATQNKKILVSHHRPRLKYRPH